MEGGRERENVCVRESEKERGSERQRAYVRASHGELEKKRQRKREIHTYSPQA